MLMFRLARLVLMMSKPLAGVNSPAMLFPYAASPSTRAVSAAASMGPVSWAVAAGGQTNRQNATPSHTPTAHRTPC